MRKVLVFAAVLACSREPKEETGAPQALEEGREVVVHETKGPRRLWTLEADRAMDLGDTLKAYGVKITFWGRGGKPQSVLTADSGWYAPRAREMRALGNVLVKASDGTELRTGWLGYRAKDELIFTDDTVKIKSSDKEVEGVGLRADPSLRRVEIVKEVKGWGKRGPTE